MEAKDIRNRNRIRKILESKVVEEDGCDASKLYIKKLLILNPIARYEDSAVIEVGEYKWYSTFLIFYFIYSRVNNCKDISKY
jgi:hypothetical protein